MLHDSHYVQVLDNAIDAVRVTSDAAMTVIDSDLSQSFQSCLNEVLARRSATLNDDSKLTEYVLQPTHYKMP